MVFQSLFPLRTNQLRGSDPVTVSAKEAANLRKTTKAVKTSKATIKDTVKHLFENE